MGHRLNYHEILEIVLRLYGPESQRWQHYEPKEIPMKESRSARKKYRCIHGCESSDIHSRDQVDKLETRQHFKLK